MAVSIYILHAHASTFVHVHQQLILQLKHRGKKIRVFLFGDYEYMGKMYGISGASGKSTLQKTYTPPTVHVHVRMYMYVCTHTYSIIHTHTQCHVHLKIQGVIAVSTAPSPLKQCEHP